LEVLNDKRVKEMLEQYFNSKTLIDKFKVFIKYEPDRATVHRKWYEYTSTIYQVKPVIKWIPKFAIETNEPGDARAVCAGMSEIKHQDPLLQLYDYSYGGHGSYVHEDRIVSMAQVAQIMSMQCLQNHSTPIEDLDRMIDLSYRNLHVVNLPMHANLFSKVNANTLEFLKCYVRVHRQNSAGLGSHLNCLSPARTGKFEPCYTGTVNRSQI
jgi:hypothetical protein